uniref:Major sperm protein n=2 Tax=Caenorhabditis tropicalis TaxID=1561998 RepID=A0A1I7UA38_9PELO
MAVFIPKPEVMRHPELYKAEKSEKDRDKSKLKENPPIPLEDPYNYQDVSNLVYPFVFDAPSVVFMGRIGLEPVTANLTIYNASHRSFWFKIKSSSREMFNIRQSCGKLEKGKQIIIPIIFYPNFKCPKPFCEYLNVYALFDNFKYDNAFEAFRRLDCLEPLKKRLYAEFILHENIGITQAVVNGKLLDMMKSKIDTMNNIRKKGYDKMLRTKKMQKEKRREAENKFNGGGQKKKNKKSGVTTKDGIDMKDKSAGKLKSVDEVKNERKKEEAIVEMFQKEFFLKIQLVDTTFKHKKLVFDKILFENLKEINETGMMTTSELQSKHKKMNEHKNCSVAASLVLQKTDKSSLNDRRKDRYEKLHIGVMDPKEYANVLWEEYRGFMKKKKIKTTEKGLSKMTNAEREMLLALKEAKEEKKKKKEMKDEKKEEKKSKRKEKNKKDEVVTEKEEKKDEKKQEEIKKDQKEEQKGDKKENEQKEEMKDNEKDKDKEQKEGEHVNLKEGNETKQPEENKDELKEKETKKVEILKEGNETGPSELPKQDH